MEAHCLVYIGAESSSSPDGVMRQAPRISHAGSMSLIGKRIKILQALLLTFVSLATVRAATVPTTPLRRVISGVQHTAWTPRDGAPAGIMAIEQSVDGALWLGSRQGLYRFDGLHFDRITVVDEDSWSPADIYALHAMPNGDLWIGQFTGGGVILLHEGKVTRYKEGLPPAGVTQFLVHPRGGFWVSTTQGLARFEGGRFHTVGPEMGLPVGQSVTCIFDADGSLIVRTFTPGLFVLHPGSSRFEHVEEKAVDRPAVGHFPSEGSEPHSPDLGRRRAAA